MKNTKPLEEKRKALQKKKDELHSLFLTDVYQILQNRRSEISQNDLLHLKREFFIFFYTNHKQIEVIFQNLNS